jgi:hypothetical protein
LLGAHTLGHVHPENSGYTVPPTADSATNVAFNSWDGTPAAFNNNYYSVLLQGWTNIAQNDPALNLWIRPNNNPEIVMTNADMALAWDIAIDDALGVIGQRCAPNVNGGPGCANPASDTFPTTRALVQSFAQNNNLFLTSFASSFAAMVTVGYGSPGPNDGNSASGKLGTVTTIDLATC